MKDLGAKKDGSGQKRDSSTPEPYRWRTQEFRVKILLRGIVVFSDDCASLPMTICERCGTENLGGSRYCDECGAALWLTGNEGEVSKGGPQGNGSQPNGSGALARREPSLALASSCNLRTGDFGAAGRWQASAARHAGDRARQFRRQKISID